MLKAGLKSSVGALQRLVRIDVLEARIIHESKQHIAKLIRSAFRVNVHLGLKFCEFLLHLVPDLTSVLPIKTNAPNLVLNAVGFDQARQPFRHAFQNGFFPFLELQLLPVGLHRFLVVGLHISVYVWVTVN